MDNRREQIIDIIKREFIGPDPIDKPGMVQENGEEILSSDPPRIRYAAGILFPQNVKSEQIIEGYEPEQNESEQEDDVSEEKERTGGTGEYLQDAEELMNLSNAYQQSAISMTVAVKKDDRIFVNVSAGIYNTVKEKNEETGAERQRYYRSPISWNNQKQPLLLPQVGKIQTVTVMNDSNETNLRFHVTFRYQKDDHTVYTFTLEN